MRPVIQSYKEIGQTAQELAAAVLHMQSAIIPQKSSCLAAHYAGTPSEFHPVVLNLRIDAVRQAFPQVTPFLWEPSPRTA